MHYGLTEASPLHGLRSNWTSLQSVETDFVLLARTFSAGWNHAIVELPERHVLERDARSELR